MNKDHDILIIGAGATGLIAARELAKAGKKVLILEARDRIGGRIMPLNESEFGFSAEGGAEFVHDEAPITKALVKEAGLTLIPVDGEMWSMHNDELFLGEDWTSSSDLKDKLQTLKKDMPVAQFVEENFTKDQKDLKQSIFRMVQGYDAADPKLMSTFYIRDEWFAKLEQVDHRIKEGYGALLNFLKQECEKHGVEIILNTRVKAVGLEMKSISILTAENQTYKAEKVVITVPVSVLKDIDFNPELKSKIALADKIGFGKVIKIVIRFKTNWWEHARGKDLSKMTFVISGEKIPVWWTQYPEVTPVLVGWLGGPDVEKYADVSEAEFLDMAVTSLAHIFKVDKAVISNEIIASKVVDWAREAFSRGAYSYPRFDVADAAAQLAEPIDNAIFFAGEALVSGVATAMVEGAFGSGLETAWKILEK